MKWEWLVLVASVGVLLFTVHTQDRRITQLECALAQAHATADSLEAALEHR